MRYWLITNHLTIVIFISKGLCPCIPSDMIEEVRHGFQSIHALGISVRNRKPQSFQEDHTLG